MFPSPSDRLSNADLLAKKNNWKDIIFKDEYFSLRSYIPTTISYSKTLTIFIEGDGVAWLNKSKPSKNPTPINLLTLRMAINHPQKSAAYLGRPCQYEINTHCEPKYWLSSRFSMEVIDATNKAINRLKKIFKATNIELVGYSGGAAIASLIAIKRSDVSHLITVAGNLDHKAWTNHHKITPLAGSLNPKDYIQELSKKNIKQTHLIGNTDTVIPPKLVYNFIEEQPGEDVRTIEIEKFNHYCCWDQHWTELWKIISSNNPHQQLFINMNGTY